MQPKATDADAGRPAPRRLLRRLRLGVRIAGALFILGAFFVKCDSFFYYPSARVWMTPAQVGVVAEDVHFQASDGLTLHGWWLPARSGYGAEEPEPGSPAPRPADPAASGRPGPARGRGTVIHFHGNAENVTAHLPLVEWLPYEGYNVLMFDYRGYGRSQGRVTRAGTIRDGHAALDYALSRPDVDPARIYLYGQSLGGAVATVVAAERPEVRAVVLESTFSSYRRIAARHLRKVLMTDVLAWPLACGLVSSGHEPREAVGRIAPRPVLILAGTNDSICFAELNRELFEAAGEPKSYVEIRGGEHLALLEQDGDKVRRAILEWLR